jgi:hypothetical protein
LHCKVFTNSSNPDFNKAYILKVFIGTKTEKDLSTGINGKLPIKRTNMILSSALIAAALMGKQAAAHCK